MDAPLKWEVSLPERGAAALGRARPRARVLVEEPGGEVQETVVPVAVGRRLAAERDAGRARPSSRAELAWLVGGLARSCGRARVEDLVGRRDYSAAELRERLGQDGYAPAVADELVERACESGLVDDARFAEAFVRSKLSCGWGRAKIERELARRGVEARMAQGWPEEFFPEGSEYERALELARRRRVTGKNDLQKIARFLCGRGFAPGVALDAAREALSSTG